MITTAAQNIYIEITTYQGDDRNYKKYKKMEDRTHRNFRNNNKYMTICSNTSNCHTTNTTNEHQNVQSKKTLKSCPICSKTCEHFSNLTNIDKSKAKIDSYCEAKVKNVQTSNTHVNNGLTLLNEVLTVFQNRKGDKERPKCCRMKDAAVSTDNKTTNVQSKLTVNTFQYSISDSKRETRPENGKFTIVNSCQPIFLKKSNYSIDLIKHKSSSIPQMKLEELKHSLKVKSRSKDAIEEVNRMFAVVKKSDHMNEEFNRPQVRNGPRVLPVVINKIHDNRNDFSESTERHNCKCCQTCMSSGDTFKEPDCCQEIRNSKCEKCIYTLCGHYQPSHKKQGTLECKHCTRLNKDFCCQHEKFHVYDDSC